MKNPLNCVGGFFSGNVTCSDKQKNQSETANENFVGKWLAGANQVLSIPINTALQCGEPARIWKISVLTAFT